MVKITPQVKKLIEQNPLALATVDSKGKPNVIGVAYVKVVADNKILVTDNYMKQTKENILKNKNVCLAVWDKKRKGYKLVGRAKYLTTGKWRKFVEEIPENKDEPAKGAILITIFQIIPLS